MASSICTGANWSVDGSSITIFGVSGTKLENGNWAVPSGLGSLLAEVDPAPISPDLSQIIEDDRAAGNEDKIAYVGIKPELPCRFATYDIDDEVV